jgi:predicted house-cleaning noncanonical NTP pyrophosphatase (MazG superfamily)
MNNDGIPSKIIKNGNIISKFKYCNQQHNYEFEIDDKLYKIINEKKSKKNKMTLADLTNDIAVASVQKKILSLRLHIAYMNNSYIMHKNISGRRIAIFRGREKIGSVVPDGLLSDNIKVQMANDASDELCIFIGWLGYFAWQNSYKIY